MFAIFHRNEFRILVLAAGATLSLAMPAVAKDVDIGGTHGKDEIKTACAAVGGHYAEVDQAYGCSNTDKGTSVTCYNTGQCWGHVPGRVAPPNIQGILVGAVAGTLADPDLSSLTSGDNGGGNSTGLHAPPGLGGARATTSGTVQQ